MRREDRFVLMAAWTGVWGWSPVLPAFSNDEFLQLGEGAPGFVPVGDTAWLDREAC